MFEPRENETLFLHVLRLTARTAAVVCLAIIILFAVGEGFDAAAISAKEIIGLLFFPLGVFVGLVLGWHEEILGGALVVLGVFGFYVIYGWLLSGSIRQGWAFLPFLIPGVLYLLYGYLIRVHLHSRRVAAS